MRTATYRPGRSVLSIAVIASATFILISVEAFRRGDQRADTGPRSGVGAMTSSSWKRCCPSSVIRTRARAGSAESVRPRSVRDVRATTLPGDDAGCLNLYEPAESANAAASARFPKRAVRVWKQPATDAERANPWLLLEKPMPDGAIPVIADANSMTYVLHKKLGDDIVLPRGDREIRLRLVAALSDSIFQGELLMAEQPFVTLFPEQQGYQILLVQAGHEPAARL